MILCLLCLILWWHARKNCEINVYTSIGQVCLVVITSLLNTYAHKKANGFYNSCYYVLFHAILCFVLLKN